MRISYFCFIMENRLEELQRFLNESPEDPFLKYALTMEWKKRGDAEKTFAGFQDLRLNHPDYVGAYYHFATILEERSSRAEVFDIYQAGMEVAQRLRNRHVYNELLAAYNLAMGVDDDEWEGYNVVPFL